MSFMVLYAPPTLQAGLILRPAIDLTLILCFIELERDADLLAVLFCQIDILSPLLSFLAYDGRLVIFMKGFSSLRRSVSFFPDSVNFLEAVMRLILYLL